MKLVISSVFVGQLLTIISCVLCSSASNTSVFSGGPTNGELHDVSILRGPTTHPHHHPHSNPPHDLQDSSLSPHLHSARFSPFKTVFNVSNSVGIKSSPLNTPLITFYAPASRVSQYFSSSTKLPVSPTSSLQITGLSTFTKIMHSSGFNTGINSNPQPVATSATNVPEPSSSYLERRSFQTSGSHSLLPSPQVPSPSQPSIEALSSKHPMLFSHSLKLAHQLSVATLLRSSSSQRDSVSGNTMHHKLSSLSNDLGSRTIESQSLKPTPHAFIHTPHTHSSFQRVSQFATTMSKSLISSTYGHTLPANHSDSARPISQLPIFTSQVPSISGYDFLPVSTSTHWSLMFSMGHISTDIHSHRFEPQTPSVRENFRMNSESYSSNRGSKVSMLTVFLPQSESLATNANFHTDSNVHHKHSTISNLRPTPQISDSTQELTMSESGLLSSLTPFEKTKGGIPSPNPSLVSSVVISEADRNSISETGSVSARITHASSINSSLRQTGHGRSNFFPLMATPSTGTSTLGETYAPHSLTSVRSKPHSSHQQVTISESFGSSWLTTRMPVMTSKIPFVPWSESHFMQTNSLPVLTSSDKLILPGTSSHSLKELSLQISPKPSLANSIPQTVSPVHISPHPSSSSDNPLFQHGPSHFVRSVSESSMLTSVVPFKTRSESSSLNFKLPSSFIATDKTMLHQTESLSFNPTPHTSNMTLLSQHGSPSVSIIPHTSLKQLPASEVPSFRPTPTLSSVTSDVVLTSNVTVVSHISPLSLNTLRHSFKTSSVQSPRPKTHIVSTSELLSHFKSDLVDTSSALETSVIAPAGADSFRSVQFGTPQMSVTWDYETTKTELPSRTSNYHMFRTESVSFSIVVNESPTMLTPLQKSIPQIMDTYSTTVPKALPTSIVNFPVSMSQSQFGNVRTLSSAADTKSLFFSSDHLTPLFPPPSVRITSDPFLTSSPFSTSSHSVFKIPDSYSLSNSLFNQTVLTTFVSFSTVSPESSSKAVTMVTKLATSAVSPSSFNHLTESSFPSITVLPPNATSIATSASPVAASLTPVIIEPTENSSAYPTSAFPPYRTSKIPSSATSTIAPSFTSSISPSYRTPVLPFSSVNELLSSSATVPSTLSGIFSAMLSSATEPSKSRQIYNNTSAATVDVTPSSSPSYSSASSPPLTDTTSVEPQDYTTSSGSGLENATLAVPLRNTTSLVPPVSSTSESLLEGVTSASATMDQTTSIIPVDNATSIGPQENTSSATPFFITTSSLPLDSITSVSVSLDQTTSSPDLQNGSSTSPLHATTSAVPPGNSAEAAPLDSTTSAVTVLYSTSAIPVDNATSVGPQENTTSASPYFNTSSALPQDQTTSSLGSQIGTSTVPLDTTMSAVPPGNSTEFVASDSTISGVTIVYSTSVDNATSVRPQENATFFTSESVNARSAEPLSSKTSAVPLSQTTSATGSQNETQTAPLDQTTSTAGESETSSIPLATTTSVAPLRNTTKVTHLRSTISSVTITYSASAIPVDNVTSVGPQENATSFTSYLVNATSPVSQFSTTSAAPLNKMTSTPGLQNETSTFPPADTSSVARPGNTTEVLPPDSTTSAGTLTYSTSAIPVDNATSVRPPENTSASLDQTTSAPGLHNGTAILPLTTTKFAASPENTTAQDNITSAAPIVNTTSAVPLGNTASATSQNSTESVAPMLYTTSAASLDKTASTSSSGIDNGTSNMPLVTMAPSALVSNATSAAPPSNTTSPPPQSHMTSAALQSHATSPAHIDTTSVESNITSPEKSTAILTDNCTSDILPTSNLPITPVNGSVSPVNVTMVTANSSSGSSVSLKSSIVPLTVTAKPTLDRSFATRDLWVMMELSLAMDVNVQDSDFLEELETNLAVTYGKARERELEREAEVKQLLKNLNPEEDIFFRKKRASSVDGNTAQIIDLSRTTEVPTTSELVFYMVSAGAGVPGMTCAVTFGELSVQELTLLMETVVLSQVRAYDVIPTTASPQTNTTLVIILSVLIPLAVLSSCICCCCLCCVCCGPKRKQNERTMAPDTFRMIEFKQKFPYKPYPPSRTAGNWNQRPNVDDGGDDDSENTLEAKLNLGGDMMEANITPRPYADGDNSFNFEATKSPQANVITANGRPRLAVHEPLLSPRQQPLLGKPNSSAKTSDLEETTRHLPALPSSSRSDSDYRKVQQEISKILEPERHDLTTKKKRRKRQGEKSSSQLTDGNESATALQLQQSTGDDTHEPMAETKQRVHALIEEAFLLVNFRAPPTTNVTRLDGQKETKEDKPEDELGSVTAARHAADLLKGRKREFGVQTMKGEEENKVMVVPVNVPPSEGTNVVWSPYNARDELERISPTREPATLPGRINSTPPPTLPRRQFPDDAETSASFTHQEPLKAMTRTREYSTFDGTAKSHEYSTLGMTDTLDSSRRGRPHYFHYSNERGNADHQEASPKVHGDFNFLLELERGRKQRPVEFYDELDVTGTNFGQPPPRSLLDSIKAELTRNNTRRLGDGL